MTRTCTECGKEFAPKVYNQLTCSQECSKARDARLGLQRDAARLAKEIRRCALCGKKFTPKKRSQRFCSVVCRCKLNSRHDYISKPKIKLKPSKSKPTKPLDEWIREARACNLDYGTYRALIEHGKTFDELFSERDKHSAAAHAHIHAHIHT